MLRINRANHKMNNTPFSRQPKTQAVSRRQLLKAGAIGVLGLMAPCASAVAKAKQSLQTRPLSEPWLTLQQVQLQLLPEDGNGPGATQAGALPFLKAALDEPAQDPETVSFIHKGVGWLNTESQNRFQHPFAALTHNQQQQVIASVAKSRAGENWLSTLLTFAIEAMLADPLYGGNINKQGWQWLQHNPGFPRPQTPWYHHL